MDKEIQNLKTHKEVQAFRIEVLQKALQDAQNQLDRVRQEQQRFIASFTDQKQVHDVYSEKEIKNIKADALCDGYDLRQAEIEKQERRMLNMLKNERLSEEQINDLVGDIVNCLGLKTSLYRDRATMSKVADAITPVIRDYFNK